MEKLHNWMEDKPVRGKRVFLFIVKIAMIEVKKEQAHG